MDSNYRSAICTNCGSELKLDSTKKNSFCAACGSRFSVSDAIRKFAVLFPTRAQQEMSQSTAAVAAAAAPAPAPAAGAPSANTPDADAGSLPDGTPPIPAEENTPLAEQYKQAQAHLDAREYIKAADIYNKILTEAGELEHAAHWGLFLVDERNCNSEEKLLQCFSCFPFRNGSDQIKKEIMGNANLAQAFNHAPPEVRTQYNIEAQKHADNIYNLYREGCGNISSVIDRHFSLLLGTFETVGITSAASRIGFPAGVAIKFMGENKLYLQFSQNKLGMLHLDVLNIATAPIPSQIFWHYRNVQMQPDTGILNWSEFRSFRNVDDATKIIGELDSFHKGAYVLLGLWSGKIIVRNNKQVFFLRMTTPPEHISATFERCYHLACIPVVEDPNSYNAGHKASEFYHVLPIASIYDTAKKSRWIRKHTAGCYIATAVYGGYDAPQVITLREFRDNVLLKNVLGRLFVNVYYTLSPPLAQRLGPNANGKLPLISRGIRALLDRFISYLRKS